MVLHSASRQAPVAIAFMVAASALLAATSLMAKILGLPSETDTGIHSMQQSAGRFVFAFIVLCLFLLIRPNVRPDFIGTNWPRHIIRTGLAWTSATLVFAAVSNMPVAEATAISFLSPVVSMVLSVFVLRETLWPHRIIAAVIALLGAVLILRPGSDAFQLAGLYALGSAVSIGLETMYIKRLSDTEPPLRILFIVNFLGTILSVTVASFIWIWPTPNQWAMLALLGATMLCAQACFIQSMKRGDASFVTPVFYTVLVFAAFYDLLLFGVMPTQLSFIGGVLILSAALVLAICGQRR